ncbi:MAG: hypothetical protein QW416_06840 [Candidatus Nitrosocaldaceae archaeon]
MNRPLSSLLVEIYDKDVINDDLIGVIKSEDITLNSLTIQKVLEKDLIY